MKEVSREIEYKEKKYKIVFNLNVIEAIQDNYGSVEAWGNLTDGTVGRDGEPLKEGETGEVDIKALIYGFQEMLNEGIEIDNEDNGTNDPPLTHKQVGRIISALTQEKVAEEVNNLVIESVNSDEKNV